MSVVAEVLVIVVATGLVLLLAGAAAFIVVRRRWRRIRDHAATRGVLATLSVVTSWRDRRGARPVSEDVGHGAAARARRRMWTAIADAEAAVQHADALDAPVADLPAVCRSLRRVGTQLDQQLRLAQRLPARHGRADAVRLQVTDVIRAARDVQHAALGACSEATEPQISALVREARDEVEIVASALSRLRSIAPR
jgi:hypothetical protein